MTTAQARPRRATFHRGHPLAALLAALSLASPSGARAEGEIPTPRQTVVGLRFLVNPAFEEQIAELVAAIRGEMRTQRAAGKLVAYISTPITARGGGYAAINREVSGDVKRRLERRYGRRRLWALAPGQPVRPCGEPIEIRDVGENSPGGGDYMYMWTQVLAGEDGRGSDIDLVYFTGPDDFHRYFVADYGRRLEALQLDESETARRKRRFIVDDRNLLDDLQDYASLRAELDADFRRHLSATGDAAGRQFVRYYAWCCSAGHSNGARDEWNIFANINRRRDIASQIPILFHGRHVPPFETNAAARPGYALDDD